MNLSVHGARRMRQRSIPPRVIELLERFGSECRCGGAYSLYFDKAARRRMQDHFDSSGMPKWLGAWLNVYMVVGDNGRIVTAAYRTTRLRRHPSTRQVTRHGFR